jgi:hypothetical protein
MFISGKKRYEIRSQATTKRGERIYIAASGTSAIYATATVTDCIGPLTQTQWKQMREGHCVPDAQRYYGESTYAWVLSDVEPIWPTIPFNRKPGAIIWQRGF